MSRSKARVIGLLITVLLIAGGSFWYFKTGRYAVLPAIQPLPTTIYYQDKAVVLLYHNFGLGETGTTITPRRFSEHLDMLSREGFHVVSLQDVTQFIEKKKRLPPNAVAITMDDGNESNYTVAYPLLKKRNWPATMFVVVSLVNNSGDTSKGAWMDWSQLAALTEDNFDICSHSYDGHKFIKGTYPGGNAWLTSRFPGEDQAAYEKRIFDDLVTSREVLKQHNFNSLDSFCIPFGYYNQSLIDAAQKAGFKYLWTTEHTPIKVDSPPWRLGRVSVGIGGTSAEKVKEMLIETGQK
ncbi:MAG TPA: polysaccharide deacetylase family protein [Syntrophomonadaceae bacterium]|nr:polysaccharide deacetylase family protein [Syntrophomonadaceae bacterium]